MKLPCFVLITISSATLADDEADLFDLTLDKLASIEVSTATKTAVPLYLAPASVHYYQHKTLSQNSIHTLADLADITPSYSSYSLYGERVLSTRGQKAGSFENNKHLILLDGIEVNHVRANKGPIEYELPLFFTEQVEMLTGPASALYGDGAFYGVVSLSSRKHDNSVLMRYGSNNEVLLGTNGAFSSELGNTQWVFSKYQKQSNNQYVGLEASELQKFYNQQQSQFSYLTHQYELADSKFRYAYIDMRRGAGLGEHWQGDYSVSQNEINWRTSIHYLQWRYLLSESFELDFNISHNDSTEHGVAVNLTRSQKLAGALDTFDHYFVDVSSSKVALDLTWRISQTDNMIFGVNFDTRSDDGGYFAPSINYNELANTANRLNRAGSEDVKLTSYLIQYQAYLPAFFGSYLTLGGRYDKGDYLDDSFSSVSPRAAWVWPLNDKFTAKLIYSTALRAPGLKEYMLNDETRKFVASEALNPEQELAKLASSLSPETFESTELVLNYTDKQLTLGANLFSNHTEKALDGTPITYTNKNLEQSRRNIFTNSAHSYDVNGVELSITYKVNEFWQLNGFYSQIESDNEPALSDLAQQTWQFSAQFKRDELFANCVYRLQDDFLFGGERINQLDVSLGYAFSTNTQLTLSATNLTDENTFYLVDSVAKNPMPERTISLDLQLMFSN